MSVTTILAQSPNWKTYESWEPLIERLATEAESHYDVQGVRPRDLQVEGEDLIVEGEPYHLDDFALQQLARGLGPHVNANYWTTYFNHEEWNPQVNRLLQRGPSSTHSWLLRLDRGADRRRAWVRGILGTKFSPYDNLQMVEDMQEVLEPDGLLPRQVYQDRTTFVVRALDPQSDTAMRAVGDIQCGVHCPNSEVGARSVGACGFLLRLICTNGMVSGSESSLHRRHVGTVRNAFLDALGQARAAAGLLKQNAKELARMEVDYPEALIQQLAQHFGLAESRTTRVLAAFGEEPTATRWGLVNAFTRAAQQEQSFQGRESLEVIGGQLTTTPQIFNRAVQGLARNLEDDK